MYDPVSVVGPRKCMYIIHCWYMFTSRVEYLCDPMSVFGLGSATNRQQPIDIPCVPTPIFSVFISCLLYKWEPCMQDLSFSNLITTLISIHHRDVLGAIANLKPTWHHSNTSHATRSQNKIMRDLVADVRRQLCKGSALCKSHWWPRQ